MRNPSTPPAASKCSDSQHHQGGITSHKKKRATTKLVKHQLQNYQPLYTYHRCPYSQRRYRRSMSPCEQHLASRTMPTQREVGALLHRLEVGPSG